MLGLKSALRPPSRRCTSAFLEKRGGGGHHINFKLGKKSRGKRDSFFQRSMLNSTHTQQMLARKERELPSPASPPPHQLYFSSYSTNPPAIAVSPPRPSLAYSSLPPPPLSASIAIFLSLFSGVAVAASSYFVRSCTVVGVVAQQAQTSFPFLDPSSFAVFPEKKSRRERGKGEAELQRERKRFLLLISLGGWLNGKKIK